MKQGGPYWDAHKMPIDDGDLEMADQTMFPQVQGKDHLRALLALETHFGPEVLKNHEFMTSAYHDRQVPSILVDLDIPT